MFIYANKIFSVTICYMIHHLEWRQMEIFLFDWQNIEAEMK